jgi:outer membrane protein assembly factor BamB
MKKPILLILLLISVSFSSLVWQFNTDGPVSIKPVVFQNAIVVASDDGTVYALDPVGGSKRWQATLAGRPNEVMLYENTLLVSTSSGKIFRLANNGVVQWQLNMNTTEFNVSSVYGASANAKAIYVSTDNGVYAVEKNGSVKSKIFAFANDSIATAPAAGADFVIVARGDELIRISETGQVQWRARLLEDTFWLSRPTIEGNTVYIGALDDRLHAYTVTNGIELWNVRSRNWVLGTPLVKEGIAYFGSNDGKVYAAQIGTGNVQWTAQTQLAVQAQPEIGVIGGKPVVFAGGSDKSVYAIARDSGEIVWKGSSTGAAGSPLFYQNRVIFGSDDGRVFAYSTERACSITSPLEGEVVSLKELVVSGKYVSEAGGATVMVQINGGEWNQANTSEVDWVLYVDPSAKLLPGLNTIACQVTDSGGSETGETFTSVAINHDPTIPLSNLVVSISPDPPIEGNDTTIYVNDGDDGSPVDRFNLTFADKSVSGNKNYTFVAPAAGTYKLTVRKIGFNDFTRDVNVNASGVNPLYIVAAVLLIVIIVWQLWTRFLSQRFAPKKR